ncbi:glycosyltransferase [Falsiroseomonas sp. HW251]|uniref:glycosyltransferase n=1 Tax=Falsiroseomonas sp. HW251 TaxID=3390998 RepID=UPI003D316EBC
MNDAPFREAAAALRPGVVLQRLPLDRDVSVRPLYLRAEGGLSPQGARVVDGRLVLSSGAAVSFDTYFGAYFEPAWRGPAGIGALVLDLEGQGRAVLRVVRRDATGRETALHEAEVALPASVAVPPPPAEIAGGRVFAELLAADDCEVTALSWRAPDAVLQAVSLVAVICTFGREAQLGAALGSIAAEPQAYRDVRFVVVNQGAAGLAAHPDIAALPDVFRARLQVIEQGNFGGCGGFTRGMLAALDTPGATHLLLMDDDIAVEPEALRRTVAFLSLAGPRVALGGQMLDLYRPADLHEAGARVDPRTLWLRPLHYRVPMEPRDGLDRLIAPEPMHYSGWWWFALPLDLVREAGLPVPCFIRGDDVEFGLRLHGMGVPTLSVPGIGVWHEPFYAKLHGWQGYYELRNALIYGALHFPRPARAIAARVARELVGHLLTFRYHGAGLALRAAEDWLRGPALLQVPPDRLHAEVAALRKDYPAATLARGLVAPDLALPRDPATRAGYAWRMLRALLRNATLPDRDAPPRRIEGGDMVWFRLAEADHVAVDTGADPALPLFRRDRATFRRQARDALRMVWRLWREGDAASLAWRAGRADYTSVPFWRRYLGMEATSATPDRPGDGGSAAAATPPAPPGNR